MNLFDRINYNNRKKARLENYKNQISQNEITTQMASDAIIERLEKEIALIDQENELLMSMIDEELKENARFNKRYTEYLKASHKLNKLNKK